jgi:chromosome segregation ATPase
MKHFGATWRIIYDHHRRHSDIRGDMSERCPYCEDYERAIEHLEARIESLEKELIKTERELERVLDAETDDRRLL